MWHENFAILGLWYVKSTALRSRQKYFFSLAAKLKYLIFDLKYLATNSKILISGLKEKTDLATSNQKKWEEPWKKLFWKEQKHSWNREILHKAVYVHLHKRKLLSFSPGLFFLWNFTLIIARYCGPVFLISFFFNMETKLRQQIWSKTEEKLLYRTHCHTNA